MSQVVITIDDVNEQFRRSDCTLTDTRKVTQWAVNSITRHARSQTSYAPSAEDIRILHHLLKHGRGQLTTEHLDKIARSVSHDFPLYVSDAVQRTRAQVVADCSSHNGPSRDWADADVVANFLSTQQGAFWRTLESYPLHQEAWMSLLSLDALKETLAKVSPLDSEEWVHA